MVTIDAMEGNCSSLRVAASWGAQAVPRSTLLSVLGACRRPGGLSLYVHSDTQDQLDTLEADDNSSAARSTRSPHDFQSGGISRLLQHLRTSRMTSVRRC